MSRNKKRINFNRIVLILIFSSGFLLIIYANNFNRKIFFTEKAFQEPQIQLQVAGEKIFTREPNYSRSGKNHEYSRNSELNAKENATEYNIFVIYTKENMILKSKFELFLKSILKFATIPLKIHLITDESTEVSLEELLKNQISIYKKKHTVKWTLYDVRII
jgi:hypothetical protein